MESILNAKPSLRNGRDDRILIASISRTGSTWLVNALANTPGTRSWPEPDGIGTSLDATEKYGSTGFRPYPILKAGDDGGVYRALWDIVFKSAVSEKMASTVEPMLKPFLKLPKPILEPLVRAGGKALTMLPSRAERNLVKTVYGCFALDWFVDVYDPRVIVTQRHPLSVIASWRDVGIPQYDLITRPEFQEAYSDWYEGNPPSERDSNMTRIAWIVGFLTTVMSDAYDRHPEWLLVNHEDMCIDPVRKFKALCNVVGIPWSDKVADYLTKSNRPGEGLKPERITSEQVDKWRSILTENEVREAVEVLMRFPNKGWIRRPEDWEELLQL
ncbi:MAG: sulfotransferase domain-containing protein [Actinomycetota bacterium]|nr:sulfotransferase domain-containing protein [Actinomycetota bacterium]